MPHAAITGTGFHVPARVVTNEELSRRMDTSDAWIRERSGIRERRWIEPGTTVDDMAAAAARQALDDAGLVPGDLDFIILATVSPDYMFPGNGVLLQRSLGLDTIGAMDVRTQCTGFIYGLATAAAFIKSGQYRRILLVASELQSNALDVSTAGRDVAVLFGDGAGAVVVEAREAGGDVLASVLHAEGVHAAELWCEMPSGALPGRIDAEVMAQGRHFPRMNGRMVFKHAVRRFCEAAGEVLAAGGVAAQDVKLFIPHQANQRITEAFAARFELAPERVVSNIERYGNTTAASIPIALAEAARAGRLERGDLLVTVAFGSGFTWGANLIRW
jgi:3-oxoacyl-[acyl-carrier-protein] synthase-3